ncbi:MAG: DUF1236 domain-containing protein [Pantoea sp.]|uniref:DUF1236 domain-containing protein n=1 Tax=Pantoea sp. TaxID=69393 RepID=UPI00239435B2|nr:DUF1236 domain-containing protein [Pantoea sp.]MDE1187838.1 DUF1236 domain-containing protein [Pantoea sp.]
MYKTLLVSSAIALASLSTGAFAQSSTVTGAAGGAVTGAVVGGPIGAAVGGVAGAIAGTAIDPPPHEVVTYVQEQPVPPATVVVSDPVVVGEPIPSDVQVITVPDHPRYAYAIINNQRVIIEPHTHKVVEVVQ